MDHSGYSRIIPSSDKAILFIHGIAGSPSHFRNLIPVIPSDWSIRNLLLSGHGMSVKDFSRSSMAVWKSQVSAEIDNLLVQHKRIYIVAHSMGTLFAIQEAINRPEDVSGLFLLAVPLRPRVKLSALLNCIRLTQGWVPPDHAGLIAMRDATSIQLDRRLWKYIGWIPRFAELLAEAGRVRKILPQLTVPAQAFQSANDELVSPVSNKYLERQPTVRITILPRSGHYSYPEDELHLLQSRLIETIEKL